MKETTQNKTPITAGISDMLKVMHAQIQAALKLITSQTEGESGNSCPISNSVPSIILGRNTDNTTVITSTNISK